MTDCTALSLGELREGLDARRFTSTDVTRAFLRRIEERRDLNCYTGLDEAQVIAEAEEADRRLSKGERLPLLGIPIALKDIILARGTRTTCGSKMLEKFESPYDATVTSRMRAAGAVIAGKTNMDEFAMGSSNETSYFGPVKNPWNPEHVPGGSSGGSAAAVAAGLCPAALGTDTGGSIRQPASFCGVVGLKPTYGRVSRYGVVAYASSLDQVGAFGATVADVALMTEVIAGHDPMDATSSPRPVPSFTNAIGQSIRGMRVGVPKEYFVEGLSPEIARSIEDVLRVLRDAGAETVEISLPHTDAAVAVYYVLAPAEASSNLARYDGVRYGHRTSEASTLRELYEHSRSEGFGREVKRRIMIGTYVLSTGYYDAYYLQAQKVRTLIARDFETAFRERCDVIVAPTTPTTAFKLGEKTSDPLEMYLNDIFTIPVNLAGLPGMSMPCGFDSAGLPIGAQFIGKAWDEESLFKVASAYEAAVGRPKRCLGSR